MGEFVASPTGECLLSVGCSSYCLFSHAGIDCALEDIIFCSSLRGGFVLGAAHHGPRLWGLEAIIVINVYVFMWGCEIWEGPCHCQGALLLDVKALACSVHYVLDV